MTVAFDAELDLGSFTTTSPDDTTFTPVGTPRGIVVGIGTTVVNTDVVTGVTYGGVAMTRIGTATASAGAGDTFRAYLYFVGASIPTGAQTIAITHSGSADPKWAAALSITAATDTEVGAFNTLSTVQTNPQIALDTGADESLRCSFILSGLGTPSDLTAISNVLAVGSSPRIDFGSNVAILGRQTSAASSGSFTIGYTGGSDDVAMVAAAIQEISGGGVAHSQTIRFVALSDLTD